MGHNNTSDLVFGSVVLVAFQSVFRSEMHENHFFFIFWKSYLISAHQNWSINIKKIWKQIMKISLNCKNKRPRNLSTSNPSKKDAKAIEFHCQLELFQIIGIIYIQFWDSNSCMYWLCWHKVFLKKIIRCFAIDI
jgi:hypothetical protein